MSGIAYIKEEDRRRNVTMTIPHWKKEKIKEIARKKGIAVSRVFEYAIDKYLGLQVK